jgi:hypothetical protein
MLVADRFAQPHVLAAIAARCARVLLVPSGPGTVLAIAGIVLRRAGVAALGIPVGGRTVARAGFARVRRLFRRIRARAGGVRLFGALAGVGARLRGAVRRTLARPAAGGVALAGCRAGAALLAVVRRPGARAVLSGAVLAGLGLSGAGVFAGRRRACFLVSRRGLPTVLLRRRERRPGDQGGRRDRTDQREFHRNLPA